MKCIVEYCDKPYPPGARGLCRNHAMRMWKYGRLEKLPTLTLEERFWAKVNKTDTCWLWTAAKTNTGYGRINTGARDGWKRSTPAHRFAYELLVGPIPGGMELDHLCHNPSCVRPEHLEPVTRSENASRAVRDILVHPRTGHRDCSICNAFFDHLKR